jgi:hypothetical protein
MPKDDIDYSNTIIYKIYCIDKTITDVYIGHTTNFTKRKYQHKSSCSNLNNKLKIYNIIRQTGGWANWNMIEISKYNCKDKTEARIKELYHYEKLNSTLNSCPPWVDKSNNFCSMCNLQCKTPKSYETHINRRLHKKIVIDQNTTNMEPKNAEKIQCVYCHFECYKKCDWNRHLSTAKHQTRVNTSLDASENASESAQKLSNKFKCNCGKIYNHDSSYYRHKKKCGENLNAINSNNVIFDKDSFFLLIKENSELKNIIMETKNYMMEQHKATQNMMMEVIKNGTNNTTNSHNKTFNLQFFLNETCKDAMNIMDFVDSIKLQLSDLEKVGRIGFVEGISNIITTNLKALDITQRPIHCTDNKREVLYIKDENKWEKEADEKDKIRKAIKRVAHKNIMMLPKFKEGHPDCLKSESKFSDQYNKLVIESFGGSGDNDTEKEDKIIKRISTVTTICKDVNN